MAFQEINIGAWPSDGSGDPLRVSFDKINDNFIELYSKFDIPFFANGTPYSIVNTVAGKTGNVILGVSDVLGAVSTTEVTNRVTAVVNEMLNNITDGSETILAQINAVANSILTDPNFTINLTNQINQRLSLSGGTMTGNLILNADPIDPLGAVTKQFVEQLLLDKLSISGGTMTGDLTLNSDPTSPLHATTKQYTDTSIQTLEQNMVANVNILANSISQVTSTTYTKSDIDQLLINIRNDDDWGFVIDTAISSDDFGVL